MKGSRGYEMTRYLSKEMAAKVMMDVVPVMPPMNPYRSQPDGGEDAGSVVHMK